MPTKKRPGQKSAGHGLNWSEAQLTEHLKRGGKLAKGQTWPPPPAKLAGLQTSPELPSSTEPFQFEIERPPSVNHLYTGTGTGAIVMTKIGRREKKKAIESLQTLALVARFYVPLRARICLKIASHFRTAHDDLDNILKFTQDVIAAALYFNDNQIDELHLYRGEVDKVSPRLSIQLSIIRK